MSLAPAHYCAEALGEPGVDESPEWWHDSDRGPLRIRAGRPAIFSQTWPGLLRDYRCEAASDWLWPGLHVQYAVPIRCVIQPAFGGCGE